MGRVRVVEFSRGVAAAYCGKVLAEAGWEVVRGPRPFDGAADLYLGSGKALAPEADLDRLASLADVVITDEAGRFDGAPGLVATITPFGATGPYAALPATELTVQAAGGLLYLIGTPDREPVKVHGEQMAYFAGMAASIAISAAVFGGRSAGERIDVSGFETAASIIENALMMPQYLGRSRTRIGNQIPGSGACTDIYKTTDGYVSLAAQTFPQWQSLAAWMGRPELADDPRFDSFDAQIDHEADLAQIIRDWFGGLTTQEAFHGAQEYRVPVGPVNTIADLLRDPHLAETRAFLPVRGTSVMVPGKPFRIDDGEAPMTEVEPVTDANVAAIAERWRKERAPHRIDGPRRTGPLAGIRVLDLTAVWAGPFATQQLADLGAEVVKIEAGVRPDMLRFPTRHQSAEGDPWNIGGWFHQCNRNKLGITLDLRMERAREILLELVLDADVLAENFSQRVMGNFGLSYERLTEVNPRLVMLSMPGFGDRGPYKDYVAFGEIIEAMAGLCSLTGYRDGPPLRAAIAFGDPVSGFNGATAVIQALIRREESGRGAHLVVSHLQGIARLLGTEIVREQTGGLTARLGNRDERFIPQGVFRCRGDDRWAALSVRNDLEWRALASVLGDGGLATDSRFAGAGGRRRFEDEIERRISTATATFEAETLIAALRTRGVPAAVVATGADVLADAHLAERKFFVEVEQPAIGRVQLAGPIWRVANEPATVRKRAPLLGEDTDTVLARLLGFDGPTLKDLRAAGVTSADVPWGGDVGAK